MDWGPMQDTTRTSASLTGAVARAISTNQVLLQPCSWSMLTVPEIRLYMSLVENTH